MQFEIAGGPVAGQAADAVVVGGFADADLDGAARTCDAALEGVLARSYEQGFEGGLGHTRVFPTEGRLPARLVVLSGLGPRTVAGSDALRSAAAAGVREAGRRGAAVVRLQVFESGLPDAVAAEAATEGVILAAPAAVRLVGLHGSAKGLAAGVRRGRILAEGMRLAQDMANAAQATPEAWAARLGEVAGKAKLEAHVWEAERLHQNGFGGLLAVGGNPAEEHDPQAFAAPLSPRLATLRYHAERDQAPLLAIVGDALLGGNALEASGAAAVAGAIQSMAGLRVPVHVLGVSMLAQRRTGIAAEGDVVTLFGGRSVEFMGGVSACHQLLLAEGVAWAAAQGARWIIDVGAVTRGAMAALGHEMGAIMANDQDLGSNVQESGMATAEELWPLPAHSAYRRLYRGRRAAVRTVADEADAATIAAGMFVGDSAGERPWCHLDIAGAACGRERPYLPEEPTVANGFASRTLALAATHLMGSEDEEDRSS